jgi:hypothetical protein
MPKSYNSKAATLRNTLAVRVLDGELRWLDDHRGDLSRSAYVRELLMRAARRDLPPQDGSDAAA